MRFRFIMICLAIAPLCGPVVAGTLPDGPYVSTSAAATHEVDPDHAVIELEFRVVQPSADAARERTSAAQESLRAVLADHDDALRDARLLWIRFGREYEYDRERQRRVETGFYGHFAFRIEVADFERLGRLHFRLAGMEWHALGEPRFEMVDPDRARRTAREMALEKATAQARSLAEARGARLGETWGIIYEPMHEFAGRSPGVAMDSPSLHTIMVSGSRQAEFAIPVEPRRVEFEARVGVVFRLEAGSP